MKIKNAMKSEECNEIRAILGLANNLRKKVLGLEQKEDVRQFAPFFNHFQSERKRL